jgi:hypothetical protein
LQYADEFKGSQSARQELDLLTALINTSSKGSKATDNFKLNLFGSDAEDGSDSTGAAAGPAAKDPRFDTAPVGVKELCFGGRNEAYKKAAGLGNIIGDLSLDEVHGLDGEPDLLDLMDSAGA